MKRPLAVLITVALVVLVSGAGLFFVARGSHDSPRSWPQESFTTEKWAATPEISRFALFNDLAQKKILDGKTRAEVFSHLGKPSFEAPDGRYITYIVKETNPGGYTIDAVYLLHIEFSDDGRVRKYFIRGD